MKRTALALLAALATGAAAADSTPRIYVNAMASEIDKWSWLTSITQICGAHIVFPWRPIDNGSGVYDWSSVEQKIAPWVSAGKKVALSFAGADAIYQQEGQDNTTLLATPDYVMQQVDVIRCSARTTSTGAIKKVPPTPVYWEPGYAENWKKFIRAAIERYQDDPRVAYLRFGVGAADESFPMTHAGSEPTCVAEWNAHGMSYQTWLTHALSIIDFIGALKPRIPIGFDMNKLGRWDQRPLGFASATSAEAAKFGFLVGNEGFSGQDADWNALYRERRRQTQTYMQALTPQDQNQRYPRGILPTILQNAHDLGIQLYELAPREYKIAYRPSGSVSQDQSATVRPALEAVGRPESCTIDPTWQSGQ